MNLMSFQEKIMQHNNFGEMKGAIGVLLLDASDLYEVIEEEDCAYWVQSLEDPDSKPLCISPSQFWQLLPSL
jgi:hypothetical protein